MGKINVLDPQVANLIAAGEVVDRPASVVKELLENSMDAGAKNITVEIKNGGISFIRVSDDGSGISKDDVPVCIKRHATSKIQDASDLDGILTLGFRGEALAAIGSVSTMRIFTKTSGDQLGTQLVSVSGEITEFSEVGCKDGTTIIVEELFANIPARRKFLKKDSSETLAITAVVEKLALSKPDTAIRYITDGITKFATSGDGSLMNSIYAVLGRDFSKKLVEVESLTNGIQVHGFIGTPENIRANRNYQNFFINGRYVKSRTAMAALEQAFSSYIPSDKFPVCVLELRLHPAFVDVNVHPAKLEVKFSNEQLVFDAVYNAVRSVLERKLSRPSLTLKDKGDFRWDSKTIGAFVPLKDSNSPSPFKGEQLPIKTTFKEFIKLTPSGSEKIALRPEDIPPHLRMSLDKKSMTDSENILQNADIRKNETFKNEDADTFSRTLDSPNPGNVNALSGDSDNSNTDSLSSLSGGFDRLIDSKVNTLPENNVTQNNGSICENTEISKNTADEIPDYKILGEAFNSYIMLETEGKLLMIDKHAAHERIIFENMRDNLKNGAVSQMMLLPMELELSPAEIDCADIYSKELFSLGFDYTISPDKRVLTITSIPTVLSAEQAQSMIVSALGNLSDGTGNIQSSREKFFETALYQASCKAAIKAGKIYDNAHLYWICSQVLSNPQIKFCPHGRPVAFELTKNDIEHWFKRK